MGRLTRGSGKDPAWARKTEAEPQHTSFRKSMMSRES